VVVDESGGLDEEVVEMSESFVMGVQRAAKFTTWLLGTVM
jgi:hypothetical protein